MSNVVNGEPLEVSPGVWIGATDFSQYALGPAPAGITVYDGDGNPNDIVAVEFDAAPEVQNYITYEPVDFGSDAGLGFDAFDGLLAEDGEVLALCFAGNTEDEPRKNMGPAMNMSDTAGDQLTAWFHDFAALAGFPDQATSDLSFIIDGIHSVEAGTAGDSIGTFVVGDFIWIRGRKIETSTGVYDIKFKIWTGLISNEPVAWTLEKNGVAQAEARFAAVGAVGVAYGPNAAVTTNKTGMAFLSFTTSSDPDTEGPPLPSEIVDSLGPTVVMTEIQGTWATGEINTVTPTPTPTPLDFRTLAFADSPWDWVDGDFQIFANPAGGVLQINLPDAAAYIQTGDFNPIHIKNIGSGLNETTEYVQVFGINGNTIDGFTDVINRLSQTNHTFVTDGTNWYLQ